MALEPGKELQNAIRTIDTAFRYAGVHYWLHFGALFGLCKNRGIIPDADFDCCVYYGTPWKKIVKSFAQYGYKMSKAILNDVDPDNIMYTGFNKEGWPHVCVSFWYLHKGIRYYCHDTHFDLKQGDVGVPKSGYYFKGFPDHLVKDKSMFKRVEWPGISQAFKISVPMFPGLDYMYPCWPYINQQYSITANSTYDEDKCRSINRSGACSPWMVHLKSMSQWNDEAYINNQLLLGEEQWRKKIKSLQKV